MGSIIPKSVKCIHSATKTIWGLRLRRLEGLLECSPGLSRVAGLRVLGFAVPGKWAENFLGKFFHGQLIHDVGIRTSPQMGECCKPDTKAKT